MALQVLGRDVVYGGSWELVHAVLAVSWSALLLTLALHDARLNLLAGGCSTSRRQFRPTDAHR